MAALTETALKRIHAQTVTTTAETWGLTERVKRVDVTNRSAGAAFVTLKLSTTFVSDDTGITTAVANGDETYVIPTGTTRTIFKSRQPMFCRGSIVGSTTDYDIEGFDFVD